MIAVGADRNDQAVKRELLHLGKVILDVDRGRRITPVDDLRLLNLVWRCYDIGLRANDRGNDEKRTDGDRSSPNHR